MLLLLVLLSVRQQFPKYARGTKSGATGAFYLGPLVGGPLVQFMSQDHLEGYIRSIKSKAHTEAFVRLLANFLWECPQTPSLIFIIPT